MTVALEGVLTYEIDFEKEFSQQTSPEESSMLVPVDEAYAIAAQGLTASILKHMPRSPLRLASGEEVEVRGQVDASADATDLLRERYANSDTSDPERIELFFHRPSADSPDGSKRAITYYRLAGGKLLVRHSSEEDSGRLATFMGKAVADAAETPSQVEGTTYAEEFLSRLARLSGLIRPASIPKMI